MPRAIRLITGHPSSKKGHPMTETTVTARPPYGSVESFARILRAGKGEFLDARALALVAVMAEDASVDGELRTERIKNVISAAELVEKEADSRDDDQLELARLRAENETLKAKLGGLAYSRPDEDPQPTSGRVPPHFESGRELPGDGPVCQGAPPGFEADCGTPGEHGPHPLES